MEKLYLISKRQWYLGYFVKSYAYKKKYQKIVYITPVIVGFTDTNYKLSHRKNS